MAAHPVHVTLRAHRLVPWLRSQRIAKAVAGAIAKASRAGFRVLHFSVQSNHVHLLVEAGDRTHLSRGMQALAIRLARQINRRLGRKGAVWGERYHARALRTPREVRHGLVYVLMNHKKHCRNPSAIDPWSSARWFAGWAPRASSSLRSLPSLHDDPVIATPRSWLARNGWRRHGLLHATDAPA